MSVSMNLSLMVGVKFSNEEFIKQTPDPLFGQCNFNPKTGKKVTPFIEEEIYLDENRMYKIDIEKVKPYYQDQEGCIVGYNVVKDTYRHAIHEIDVNKFILTDEQINALIDILSVVRPVSKDEIKVYLVGFLS